MKSPAELRSKLRRQWENASCREARLTGDATAWPISLSIGKPSSQKIKNQLDAVKRHIEAWRKVPVGQVIWEDIVYRHASQAVSVPIVWRLSKPTQWIDAIADVNIRAEFRDLAELVQGSDDLFRSLLVRKRSLWRGKTVQEVLLATRLAMALEPGCAQGRPLRTLSIEGIDTKFFERNSTLVVALLDARYENQASELGLETFLGAPQEAEHWLLVVDLDGGLLPFEKIRIKSSDLAKQALPGKRVLIVENETSQHQLCPLAGTIAVLGSGFDLNWTQASWLKDKQVGYWGDIDTWGLLFLAKAKQSVDHLESLLMDSETFELHRPSAVSEPVCADSKIPEGLEVAQAQLYQHLLDQEHGRLEQEFLPTVLVHRKLKEWSER
ncbi:MAG: Wadjet anti-phage system protein JetD domain-containing protein [Pirellula sp.]